MSAIRLTVAYYYDRYHRLKQDGTAAVGVQAYLGGKERFFNSGIYISPRQWHPKLRQVVHHKFQYQLNRELFELKTKLQNHIMELEHMGEKVTLDRLKDYEQETFTTTFTEFYEIHLEKEQFRLAKSTYTDQRQTLEKLREYQPTVTFPQFNVRFLKGFIDDLHSQGLSQNTVHKHFKNIRKYARLAVKLDYLAYEKNPCSKMSVAKEQTDRLFLLEHELELFENYEPPAGKEHLAIIKDFFLFSCYTGIRFVDLSQIDHDCVIETPQGVELFLRAQKTKKPYRQNLRKLFPLPGQKKSRPEQIILRRYEQQFLSDKPLFVYTTTQTYNDHLKTIARSLPVRKAVKDRITSHAGRHTFGTIMAGKIDVHFLKELMQHSNIRETMIYVHLSKSAVNRALDKAEW